MTNEQMSVHLSSVVSHMSHLIRSLGDDEAICDISPPLSVTWLFQTTTTTEIMGNFLFSFFNTVDDALSNTHTHSLTHWWVTERNKKNCPSSFHTINDNRKVDIDTQKKRRRKENAFHVAARHRPPNNESTAQCNDFRMQFPTREPIKKKRIHKKQQQKKKRRLRTKKKRKTKHTTSWNA